METRCARFKISEIVSASGFAIMKIGFWSTTGTKRGETIIDRFVKLGHNKTQQSRYKTTQQNTNYNTTQHNTTQEVEGICEYKMSH